MEILESNNIVTLRDYINQRKGRSFLNLMKNVDLSLKKEHEKGLAVVDINLDQITINQETNEIILPTIDEYDPLERTTAIYKTGVGMNTDRKSSIEHNEASLALMILGWYVNSDHSAVESDMVAVEKYQEYEQKIPKWISRYFEDRLKRMSNVNFSDYYDENFTNKMNKDISSLELEPQDRQEVNKRIIKSINNNIKTLLSSSRITEKDVYGFYEQYVLDNYKKNFSIAQQDESMTQGGPGQSLVKTLYKPGTEREYLGDEISYHQEEINNKPSAAFATMLVLALIGVLSLLVSVVSFMIFSKIF